MARVLLFAAAREAAGAHHVEVEAATLGEALKFLVERCGPELERVLGYCTLLVGDRPVARERAWDVALSAEDEVAVLPPVSGGRDAAREPPRMVDVAPKPETAREAVAECRLVTQPDVRDRLLGGLVEKGDAVAAASVAGTLAAKRVPDLIPLCHPVRTTFVGIECAPAPDGAVAVRATVRGTDRTGFEMEALTAAAIAALTLYDMAKSEDPAMRIEGLRLVSKSGGSSGEWRAP